MPLDAPTARPGPSRKGPPRADQALASDARFWDRLSTKYAASAVSDPQAWSRTIERTRERLLPADCVLELGCGTGSTALRLAGRVSDYLATDLSEDMIAIARAKLEAAPPGPLSFQVATAESIAPVPGGYDVVLGFNYLHLVRELSVALSHIRALLRPGGLLITKTPCIGEMNILLRGVALPVMQMLGKAPYVGTFREAQLTEAMRLAGFEILEREIHVARGTDHRPWLVARRV